MEDQRATSRYAKACRECATTKAKCIRHEHALKCERCTRLNKECKARAAATRAPRVPKANRLTQMEQKLDGLVTLLVATQPQRRLSATSDSAPLLTPGSSSPEVITGQGGPVQINFVPDLSLQQKNKASLSSGEPGTNPGDNIVKNANVWPNCHTTEGEMPIASLDLTDEAAKALLEYYQISMARYFPFVIIPENTTARDLRTAKPFLFLTVMAVSSYSRTGQQTTLGTEVMRRLSDQMLFKGEKSMDLLQGILVYIEWYQSHRLVDPQLTNILCLSTALVVDLGLHKIPYVSDHQQPAFPDASEQMHAKTFSRTRSNDERRAFLGCFYLSSSISSCFRKVDVLRHTAQVEESCNALFQHPEYESDKYLVQLVRLQCIVEQINQALPYDLPQSLWTPGTPLKLLVNGFHRELQSFEASLPQSLKQDILLQAHIQNSAIYLFEISLGDWPRQPPYSPTTANTPLHRLEILHQALLSTSTLLTTFLAYPSAAYSSFPFMMWGHSVHALQVLSKISLLAADDTLIPGWSLAHVQEVIDFATVLDRLCVKFDEQRIQEEAVQRAAGGPLGSRYEIYAARLLIVKAWHEVKMRSLQMQRGGVPGVASAAAADPALHDSDRDLHTDVYGVVGGPAMPGGQQRPVPGGMEGLRDELWSLEMLENIDDAYWHDFLAEWSSL